MFILMQAESSRLILTKRNLSDIKKGVWMPTLMPHCWTGQEKKKQPQSYNAMQKVHMVTWSSPQLWFISSMSKVSLLNLVKQMNRPYFSCACRNESNAYLTQASCGTGKCSEVLGHVVLFG